MTRLEQFLADLAMFSDHAERIQVLISIGERFEPAPPDVAAKPYDESHRVPGCESEAFVWATGSPASVQLHYAVENPQGISAMALAVILKENLDGESAATIAGVSEDLVTTIFGRELSMGKSMGLTGMVRMTREWARRV